MWNPNCKLRSLVRDGSVNTPCVSLSALSLRCDQWIAWIDLSCRPLPWFRLPLTTNILWRKYQKHFQVLLCQTVGKKDTCRSSTMSNLLFLVVLSVCGINGPLPVHQPFSCQISRVSFDARSMAIESIPDTWKNSSIESERRVCKFHAHLAFVIDSLFLPCSESRSQHSQILIPFAKLNMTLRWPTQFVRRRFSNLSKNVIPSIPICTIWSKIKTGTDQQAHLVSHSSRIFALLVPIHSSIFTNNDHLMISLPWYRCCLVSDSFHKSHWVSIKVCYDSPPTAINSTSSGRNPLSMTVFPLLLLKISSISFKESRVLGRRAISPHQHHQGLSNFLVSSSSSSLDQQTLKAIESSMR